MYLNCNIPLIQCKIRKEYLYNLEKHHDEFIDGTVFGVKSIKGQALLFHAMTDIGAIYDKLPISAFAENAGAPHIKHDILQMWDNFSYHISCTRYEYLKNRKCQVLLKDGKKYNGVYLFTIDWAGESSETLETSYAEATDNHKCAHIIELDNGCYAAQPNNRILWHDPNFIMKPFETVPDYKLNQQHYVCEQSPKWVTEDTDNFAYKFEDK